MTDPRHSFLSDILEHPEDDTPRLIYADWLDDNGEADRGEFIRKQCALAKLGPPRKSYTLVDSFVCHRRKGLCEVEGEAVKEGERIDLHLSQEERDRNEVVEYKADWFGVLVTDVKYQGRYDGGFRNHVYFKVDAESVPWAGRELQERAEQLWLAGRAYWGADLPSLLGDATNELSWWRRGFVASLSCTLVHWLKHGPQIVQAQPIEEVKVSGPGPYRASERGVRSFFWYRRRGIYSTSSELPVVPEELWPDNGGRGPHDFVREFPKAEAAHAWLNQQALRWAREQAKTLRGAFV